MSYEKEVAKEQERLAKFKAENKDDYDIKKQVGIKVAVCLMSL